MRGVPLTDGLTLDALLDALASRVAEKLRTECPSNGGGVRPRLLNIEEAAIYLGRSKTGIQHLIAEGAVPAVRSDRRVFLDREDLDRWIDGNKV